jgi:manganese transport protein
MTHFNLLEARGWGRGKSLEEVHRSVPVPNTSWFWKMLAFSGPGYLVAVGYMDPGNWATDLVGGSDYGYALLSVILISNLIAILLQHLSAKLGIATGRDLAQKCSESMPKPVAILFWLAAELMIIACDLAEVIGSAIGLNLLFGIPIFYGVVLTSLDVLILLTLQRYGFRFLEAIVVTLIATIMLCFGLELFFAQPAFSAILIGFIPAKDIFLDPSMLYVAMGILGATVMPHNLYLHSALVQTRRYEESEEGKREAIRFLTVDSTVALSLAFFVNAAILIVSAAVFHGNGVSGVADISEAFKLISPIVGTGLASTLFAVALLASGQNSTVTGTLAGQIIMEGFVGLRLSPWLRRLITRSLAIVPALGVIAWFGEGSLTQLLVFSQVILSIQLPFAVVPLVYFTSSTKHMGSFVNARWVATLGIIAALSITILNIWLVSNVISTL